MARLQSLMGPQPSCATSPPPPTAAAPPSSAPRAASPKPPAPTMIRSEGVSSRRRHHKSRARTSSDLRSPDAADPASRRVLHGAAACMEKGPGNSADPAENGAGGRSSRRTHQTCSEIAAGVAGQLAASEEKLRKRDEAAIRSYTRAFKVENGRRAAPDGAPPEWPAPCVPAVCRPRVPPTLLHACAGNRAPSTTGVRWRARGRAWREALSRRAVGFNEQRSRAAHLLPSTAERTLTSGRHHSKSWRAWPVSSKTS